MGKAMNKKKNWGSTTTETEISQCHISCKHGCLFKWTDGKYNDMEEMLTSRKKKKFDLSYRATVLNKSKLYKNEQVGKTITIKKSIFLPQ